MSGCNVYFLLMNCLLVLINIGKHVTTNDLLSTITYSVFESPATIGGLHYNLSDYDEFELSKVIEEFRYTNLHLNLWNPLEGLLHTELLLDAYTSDPIDIAEQLCDGIIRGIVKYDFTALVRCLSSALYTTRWRRTHIISNISMFYELLPYEEEITSLLQAYDKFVYREKHHVYHITEPKQTETDRNEESHVGKQHTTACILGSPTAHSILPALVTKNIQRILVFSRTFDDDYHSFQEGRRHLRGLDDVVEWNYFYASEVAVLLEKEVDYVPLAELWSEYAQYTENTNQETPIGDYSWQYLHLCDVIQFQPEFTIQLFEERHDQRNGTDYASIVGLAKYLSFQNHSSSYSKWLSQIISIEYSHLSTSLKDVFDWQLSSTWMLNFYHNGKQVGYYNDRLNEKRKNWSTIRIGRSFDDSRIVANYEQSSSRNSCPSHQQSPKKKKVTKDSIVIVLTSTQYVFLDNLFAIQEQLKDIGFPHVYASAEWSPLMYELLEHKSKQLPAVISGEAEGLVLHIAVSALDITLFGKYSVIYNSEQLWAQIVFGYGFPRYQQLFFEQKTMIWTFSNDTLEFFTGNLVKQSSNVDMDHVVENDLNYRLTDRLALVSYYHRDIRSVLELMNVSTTEHSPYQTHKLMHNMVNLEDFFTDHASALLIHNSTEIIEQIKQDEHNNRNYHNYALFMGGCSYFREPKVRLLENWFNEVHYLYHNVSRNNTFYNFCGSIERDYIRDFYIYRARVVLNIHNSPQSSLELHRINYLLANGKLIISEQGNDNDILVRQLYEGCVVFIDSLREMFDKTMYFLINDTAWEEQVMKANECYEKRINPFLLNQADSAMNKTLQALENWININ